MKKKKWDVINLEEYIPHTSSFYCNTFYLRWFELMRYHEEKFVWFGVGQWSSHIMDWRGCNFWHSRLPKSPIFGDPEEAIDWLYFQVEHGVYKHGMELHGHHSGDPDCKSCNKHRDEDDIWDGRETDVIVSPHEINGAQRLRKSRTRVYKDNERKLF